jgi:hypothetical protein
MKTIKVALACAVLPLMAACSGPQPHMHAALDDLRAARAELQAAEANKGGHREKALEAVEIAIKQVEDGIAFAAAHH